MKRPHVAVLSISACLVLLGIGFSTAADDKTAPNQSAGKPKVSLEVVTWEQTQKLVAAHKGKIVVLDAWSTSCQPCMKEFPNLVKLHEKYGKKGLVCISLSCDYQGIKNKPPEFNSRSKRWLSLSVLTVLPSTSRV